MSEGPDFGAYLLLATIHLEIGDLSSSLEAARSATYLDPDSPAGHYMLGTIHHRMGARELASRKMAVVISLLQMHPGDARVSEHFNVTAAELRANARTYLGSILEA